MNNQKKTTVFLVQAAVIAALYAALTLFLAPISFSGNQFRVAEALTLLPVLTPAAIPGLAVGCIIGNITSPYGIVDIIFGTCATLLAAICTRLTRNIRIKGLPVLSVVFPVIFNALIIGAEITFLASEGFQWRAFVLTAASVGFGEIVVCFLLGLPMCAAIEKIKIFKKG